MKCLLLLLVFTSFCRADELSDTIAELKTARQKLESYEASYQLATEEGKTGKVAIGADFKSGWGYVITTLRDSKGEIIAQAEQWTTDGNLFVMKAGDEIVVFEGMNKCLNRIHDLHQLFTPEPIKLKVSFQPQCHLTKDGFEMGIHDTGNKGQSLVDIAEQLLGKTDKEVKLQFPQEYGLITLNRANGLITSQVIPVGQKERLMTLTTFKENPGKKAIQSRMTFKYHDVSKRPLSEMGFGKKHLREVLQNFLVMAGAKPENIKGLRETLIPGIEPGIIKFLSGERLGRAGFVKQKMINSFLDQIVASAIPKLKADGKNFTPKQLLQNPGFQNQVISTLTTKLLPRVPPQKKQEFLSETLTKRLSANTPTEIEARTLIEDLIIRAYFKTRLKRSVDQYTKQLNKPE